MISAFGDRDFGPRPRPWPGDGPRNQRHRNAGYPGRRLVGRCPSKTVLEFMWRTGTLEVSGRQGFQKIYDLTGNVIPAPFRDQGPSHDAFVDWACASAIARLSFATPGEIARFWALVMIAEATAWCAGISRDRLQSVAVEIGDGGRSSTI